MKKLFIISLIFLLVLFVILLFLKKNCYKSKKINNIEPFKSLEDLCDELPPLIEVNYALHSPIKQDSKYYLKG